MEFFWPQAAECNGMFKSRSWMHFCGVSLLYFMSPTQWRTCSHQDVHPITGQFIDTVSNRWALNKDCRLHEVNVGNAIAAIKAKYSKALTWRFYFLLLVTASRMTPRSFNNGLLCPRYSMIYQYIPRSNPRFYSVSRTKSTLLLETHMWMHLTVAFPNRACKLPPVQNLYEKLPPLIPGPEPFRFQLNYATKWRRLQKYYRTLIGPFRPGFNLYGFIRL